MNILHVNIIILAALQPFPLQIIYPFPPNSGRPIEMEMAKLSTNQRKKKKLDSLKNYFEAWKHPCCTFMIRWMFAEASMGPWLYRTLGYIGKNDCYNILRFILMILYIKPI